MKIRVIHGIHSPEGDNNIARFAPHLQRVMPHAEVLLFQYGFTGIGINQKGGNRFIHLDDCGPTTGRPRPTMWSY